MYQPLPLNMIAGDEIRRRTGFPHRSQVAMGSSLMLCLTSNLYEQLSH